MPVLRADFAPVHLNTKHLSVRKRVEQWHDVVGRQLLRIDSEPLRDSDVEFDADLTLRALPGIRMATGSVGGSRDRRTRELTHDGNDDVVLLVNLSGPLQVAQRQFETVALADECLVLTCSEPAAVCRPLPGRALALFLSRARLAPLVESLDDAHGRIPSAGLEAMRLLTSYLLVLNGLPGCAAPDLCGAIGQHVFDLAAVAIGARKECANDAFMQSVPVVRLRVLMADIVRNAGSPDYSLGKLAARHRLTQRQIQRLFAKRGTTFSKFLLGERLSRAHRVLSNLRVSEVRISDVAHACGFGDLSYFNRTFLARYGVSPTELQKRK